MAPQRREFVGKIILVVEDNYLLAIDLSDALSDQGARVVGPAAKFAEALSLATTQDLDGAVLDVDLDGTQTFEIAEALKRRGVPFVFATGYDDKAIPEQFRDMVLMKPAHPEDIAQRLFGVSRPT